LAAHFFRAGFLASGSLELDAKLQFPRLATGARRHNTAGSPSEACISLIRTSEEND
jgi:hypothetical protein